MLKWLSLFEHYVSVAFYARDPNYLCWERGASKQPAKSSCCEIKSCVHSNVGCTITNQRVEAL